MTFEEITDSNGNRHIMIDLGDGAFKSFPADENNPEYVAWLESQTPPKTSKSK
jgi:antibiotic biosynthesis monooxygenase (ABM) superfamily enzyme